MESEPQDKVIKITCSVDQPLFERRALLTIKRAIETFAGRGIEYGDTWGECTFNTMKSVARKLGCQINPEHFRALATAAFIDMKYWRHLGGYKDDSMVDGINYSAFLAEEMRQLETKETK